MDATLRSLRFRQEREASWRQLEQLLDRAEKRAISRLSDDEMLSFPALYRAALSSLSVARATSLDQALIDYLETLSARAYFFVYGARTSLKERASRFFSIDWPAAVSAIWAETLVAALITLAGALTAFMLVTADPDWYSAFVSPEMAGGRDTAATTEELRKTLYADPAENKGLSVFATYLFTHNAQVAFFAFALGFAFCLPSSLLLAYNGTVLGAMMALFMSRGLGFEFTGWIVIHGVTELFAIILAGAAGLRIGWSIAFPRDLSRMVAATNAGKLGAIVMIGVTIMLLMAGLLEGFARQLVTFDLARYAIACLTGVLWFSYFYRRGNNDQHRR